MQEERKQGSKEEGNLGREQGSKGEGNLGREQGSKEARKEEKVGRKKRKEGSKGLFIGLPALEKSAFGVRTVNMQLLKVNDSVVSTYRIPA